MDTRLRAGRALRAVSASVQLKSECLHSLQAVVNHLAVDAILTYDVVHDRHAHAMHA
jgi:hypothetical protein